MFLVFFLSFFRHCTTPSIGLRAGGLRLKATVRCKEKIKMIGLKRIYKKN